LPLCFLFSFFFDCTTAVFHFSHSTSGASGSGPPQSDSLVPPHFPSMFLFSFSPNLLRLLIDRFFSRNLPPCYQCPEVDISFHILHRLPPSLLITPCISSSSFLFPSLSLRPSSTTSPFSPRPILLLGGFVFYLGPTLQLAASGFLPT